MANSALEEKEKEKRVYEQSIRELRGQVTATSSREAILEVCTYVGSGIEELMG